VRIEPLKFPLSLAGLLLALIAVGLDDRRVTWAAIAVLAAAIIIRFGVRRSANSAEEPRSE